MCIHSNEIALSPEPVEALVLKENRPIGLSFIYYLGVLVLGRIETYLLFCYADGEIAHCNIDTFFTYRDADGKIGSLGDYQIYFLGVVLLGVVL